MTREEYNEILRRYEATRPVSDTERKEAEYLADVMASEAEKRPADDAKRVAFVTAIAAESIADAAPAEGVAVESK